MGAIQHQAPDTTSPSPPRAYNLNGSAVANVNGFPSAMLPQGKITHRNVSILFIFLCIKIRLFHYGDNHHQQQLVYVINRIFVSFFSSDFQL